jgi:hypothetical protein
MKQKKRERSNEKIGKGIQSEVEIERGEKERKTSRKFETHRLRSSFSFNLMSIYEKRNANRRVNL